jgi:peptidoglycan/LPS O-acetylase OafA/YrhL
VAVLCVLVYHAGLPLRAGYVGVDVFFVVSGFLITGLLLREVERTGTVRWGAFLSRRVRRLLPAAVTVLVTTALVAWLVVPGLRRREIGLDVASAAGYVVNWRLADRAVDYLAGDGTPSPVQHFWSLAVEEQFYLVWPLILLAVVVLVRRTRARPGSSGRSPEPSSRPWRGLLPAVAAVLAVASVASFAWALWLGWTDPERGYFVTTTRVWELGIGALLAVAATGRWLPSAGRWAAPVGWAGLAAIVVSAAWLPRVVSWPGPWTLAPVLGAAAVIVSGTVAAPSGRSVASILRPAPMGWIGGLSYSLYLWHWPLIVLAGWAIGGLSLTQRVLVVVASVGPAWLSHRFIEEPARHSGASLAPRAVVAAGACLSLVAVAASLPAIRVTSPFEPRPAAFRFEPGMGAEALSVRSADGPTAYERPSWDWLVPDPEKAVRDRPDADVDHCQVDEQATTPVRCTFGAPGAAHTVALVGDSKAMQWLPALRSAAQDVRVVTYGKSSCAFSEATTDLAGRPYQTCDEWNQAVMDALRAEPPDLVVTSSSARDGWAGDHASTHDMVDGLARRWGDLRAAGIPVVVIGDNPASPDDLDVCAARHPRNLDRCSFDATDAVRQSALPVQRAARARAPGTRLIDLTSWICPQGRCPIAIGHVTVHRPGHHITATYAASLARHIVPPVTRSLERERPGPGRSRADADSAG